MNTPTHIIRTAFAAAAVSALALLLGACPNPVTATTVNQMTDKSTPAVNIFSPAGNSAYTQTVTVQGTVVDNGQLRSLSYTVTGTLGALATGEVPLGSIGADGAFSFQFGTISFSGPIAITVAARDWNDNLGTAAVTLSSPGNAISSFTATPGNKTVDVSWEEVPGATYTLYYTTNVKPPTESYYADKIDLATTSYSLSNLKNGVLHVFLLKAHTASTDYWSGYVQAIPLSSFTLAPLVTGGYREIQLEWSEIEGIDEFEVYRSTDPAGPYVNHTGVISGNSFIDPGIPDNTWYYYRVRPAMEGSILSTFNGAQTFQIPPTTTGAINSVDTPAPANSVKISGSYAYVAAGSAGLLVVDISTPKSPRIVASVPTTDARDVDLGGSYAYVANGSGGLVAINISNPLAPSVAGSPLTWANASATVVSVVSGYAYVLDTYSGTSVKGVNISNPASMSLRGSYSNGSYVFADLAATITSSYHFLYVATGTSDALLEVYVSDPTTMTASILSSYTDNDAGTNYYPMHVAVKPATVSGDNVYVLGMAKTYLEPPPPFVLQVLRKWPAGTTTKLGESSSSNGFISDLNVSGTLIAAADGLGLRLYDVSTPAAPVMEHFWNTPGSSTGAVSDGTYGYVTSGSLGFQTVDLHLPTTLQITGTYSSANVAASAIRGPYAYVAVSSGSPRLQVVDITDPASPQARGSYALSPAGPVAIAVSSTFAFLATGSAGLSIIDISNPLAPALAGSASAIFGNTVRIAVKGDFAYLASRWGLQIFDISDPLNPVSVGYSDSDGGGMWDVAIRGHYAYVTDGAYFQPNSLKVIDVSNPEIPVVVGKGLTSGMQNTGVALFGDYAFVADSFPDQGVFAVDITTPSIAPPMTSYGPCDTTPGATPGSSERIAVFGGYAYVADGTSGLSIVDISLPSGLTDSSLVQSLSLTGAQDVGLSGQYAFVADSTGLRIVRLY